MNVLIVVDVQNDFFEGGALEVPNSLRIIPFINQSIKQFPLVIATQDFHPSNHISFASNHPPLNPFDTITCDYGEQILWTDHCIQDTKGADFHSEIVTNGFHFIIRKGFRQNCDSYSAFFENDRKTPTGLHRLLSPNQDYHLHFCGLALEYCVQYSIQDAQALGYKTTLISEATAGFNN